MANSNRRSWGSGRPQRDPTQRSKPVSPSTGSPDSGQADGFVESADFLPDWLAAEPTRPARANPKLLSTAEQPETLPIDEEDDLAAQLALLDQLYESEPAAAFGSSAAVSVFDTPPLPTTTQTPQSSDEPPVTDDVQGDDQGLSSEVLDVGAVEENDMLAVVPLAAEQQSEPAEEAAAEIEPLLEPQPLPAAVPSPVTRATLEVEPMSTPFVAADAPEPVAAPSKPSAVPVVSAAVNQTATPRPVAQLTPAVATSGYATPSRATSVVRQPARKAAQGVERGRPRRQRTRKVLLEGGLQRVPVRIFDRFAKVSLLLVLLFGLLSFLILRFNPFAYFAVQSATAARPQTVRPPVDAPGQGSEWCLTGDFLDNQRGHVLSDNGLVGDTIAGDRVFSLQQTIAQPGTYSWQVAACNDPEIVFPPEPTWVVTTQPNETVLFTVDGSQRGLAHFVSAPYVVAADDSAASFRVIGDFQDWDRHDPNSMLQRVGAGIYQHVRRLSQADQYNAYVVAADLGEEDGLTAIDGYGRTTAPIPLTFRTMRRGDTAVFLLDLNKGRATVLYNMNPFLTQMAYYGGNWLTGLLVGAVALLILLWLLLRSSLLWRHRSWLDSGCPRCHEHELMRVERQLVDRLLHLLGLPAYRYQCRHCTWQGLRLSIGGLSASPRSRLARR